MISIKLKNADTNRVEITGGYSLGMAICSATYKGKTHNTMAMTALDATCDALHSHGIEFDLVYTRETAKKDVEPEMAVSGG